MDQNDTEHKNGTGHGSPSPDDHTVLKLRSLNTLINVAMVCAFVSLILGGIIFSIAALVCTIVASVQGHRIARAADKQRYGGYVRLVRTRIIVSFVICAVALVYSIYTLVNVWPMFQELMDGGSIDDIIGLLQDAATEGSESPSDSRGLGGTGTDSVFG